MRKPLLALAILLNVVLTHTHAQVSGGRNVYSFLELPASARLTGLAGYLISVRDEDITLADMNPALINPLGHQQIRFQHNFHLGNTGTGYLGYGYYHTNWATMLHGGIRYMQYGDITMRDEFNNPQGTFQAGDIAVSLGASRVWDERLRYGINLRYVQSVLEAYRSSALLTDIGVHYENPETKWGVGLVLQHIGTQLTTFSGQRETMPFNALIGVHKRLSHLPFRLSVTAHNLHRWNVRYDDPALKNTFPFPGQEPVKENKAGQIVDNLFRHLVFNGEFLLGKKENFRLRVGYDHRLRREMIVPGYRGLAGFTGGVGLKVYRFNVDYGFAVYHLAGSAHHIGIGTDLRTFFRTL